MAWDKSHLIMVYDSLDVLLDRVFQYLIERFYNVFISDTGLQMCVCV